MSQRFRAEEPDLPAELQAIFHQSWDQLPPPPGRFDAVLAAARRRRRRRQLTVAVTAAAAAVVLVMGLSAVLPSLAPSPQHVAAPADTPKTSAPGPQPTTATTSTLPTTATTAPGEDLPRGATVPATAAPRSVSTAANGVVYALAEASCPGGTCATVLRTTDDGATWRALPTPAGARVSDVRFANPREGWVYGEQLWVTHDGAAEAATWTRVDVGATVLDLATDGTTVWAFVADCTSGPERTCRSGRLLAAAVGSDHFAPVPGTSVSETVLDAQLSIAGTRGALLVTGPVEGRLFMRHGDRWTPGQAPCTPAVAVLAPATGPEAGLVAVCAQEPGAGSVTYVTHRSLDGGASWARVGPGLRAALGAASVAAASLDRLAVAVGTPDLQGGLWVSQDGGATWSQPASLPTPQTGWAWVGAAGGARYLAVPFDPTGSLWISSSAGRSWTSWALR